MMKEHSREPDTPMQSNDATPPLDRTIDQTIDKTNGHSPLRNSPTDPTVYPWDTGAAVVALQEMLCAYGFPLRMDGDFGWRTEAAVRTFQKQQNLRVDSIVGPKTWAALKQNLKPGCRTLHHGHRGTDVEELQGLLQICGYRLQRDGVFGSQTEAAVKDFQQHHHLQNDGIVGANTWTLLRAGKPIHRPQPAKRWLINSGRWW